MGCSLLDSFTHETNLKRTGNVGTSPFKFREWVCWNLDSTYSEELNEERFVAGMVTKNERGTAPSFIITLRVERVGVNIPSKQRLLFPPLSSSRSLASRPVPSPPKQSWILGFRSRNTCHHANTYIESRSHLHIVVPVIRTNVLQTNHSLESWNPSSITSRRQQQPRLFLLRSVCVILQGALFTKLEEMQLILLLPETLPSPSAKHRKHYNSL